MIWFLWPKYVSSNKIHWQLTEVYVDGVLRIQYVRKWCSAFKNGPNDICDGECTSQPSTGFITSIW